MSEYKMKSMTELEVITELSDETMVVVEEGGSLKRANSSLIDSGVTHWDDLEGKPFSEEITVTYLPEQECVFSDTSIYYDFPAHNIENRNIIREGTTYILTLDGISYRCVADEVGGNYAFGNLVKVYDNGEYEDNNMPFVVYYLINGDYYEILLVKDESESGEIHTISIEQVERELIPLPTEYLPAHEHKWEDIEDAPEIFSGSWDDLEDKPFGEWKEVIWSGTYADMETLETHTIDGKECVKVAEDIEVEDLIGCKYTMYENGYPTNEGDTLYYDDFEYLSDERVYKLSNWIYGKNMSLWITKSEYYYVGEIYNPIYKSLSDKYIPTTIPRIPTAEVGQVVRVKAVDSWGVPTEWEAADMGGGDTFAVTCVSVRAWDESGDSWQETCTSDKTHSEIANAIRAHKKVELHFLHYTTVYYEGEIIIEDDEITMCNIGYCNLSGDNIIRFSYYGDYIVRVNYYSDGGISCSLEDNTGAE